MHLSEDQIRNGFWFRKKDGEFPPPPITYPSDFGGGEKINIVCTQLSITQYKQKKLVEEWIELLPNLNDIRYLWFHSRVNQALFDAVCSMTNLVGLFIKWSGIKDIACISDLINLKYLHIGSSSQIQSVEPLSNLTNLLVLEVENISKMRKLDFLQSLTQLEGLAVNGSIWTTQVIETLSPISKLENLRYLYLYNLRSMDKTLKPLVKLESLINLSMGFRWLKSEMYMLRESLPNLKYGNVFDDENIERFGR